LESEADQKRGTQIPVKIRNLGNAHHINFDLFIL